jgi:ergothioneine biosynthesis protein EgtB
MSGPHGSTSEDSVSDRSVPEASRAGGPPGEISRADLVAAFRAVRGHSEWLCEPLATEDYVLQCMAEASPTRWHLAHTTWFFERFILQEHALAYLPVDLQYYYLFNSYYEAHGPMHKRSNRGQVSRPTVREVYDYRRTVDERLVAFIGRADDETLEQIAPLVVLGCNHEQQHQELMLTDLKINLSHNPLLPVYRELVAVERQDPSPADWIQLEGGIHSIGTDGPEFHYDNEGPRHEVLLRPFALSSRLTTNAEYLAFIEDGGYEEPHHWLDLGIRRVREEAWSHPVYWFQQDGAWREYSLGGPVPLEPTAPVCHLSYFEADAFARWAGHRLPTEAEWEVAAASQPIAGNLLDARRFRTVPAVPGDGLRQIFGDVWEWTSSSYSAYPGYRPPPGAVGEYNGKFMCNQYVLRGGSCATWADHMRVTYRNFFPPESRWQFSGIRLAKDI